MSTGEPREELLNIAASLRAYLEWQVDCGASGIPRRPRSAQTALAQDAAGAHGIPASSSAAVAEREAEPQRRSRKPPPVGASDPSNATAPAVAASHPSSTTAATDVRVLAVVRAEVEGCTKCGLHSTRKKTVFERGNPESKICFVGEAPGADEDAQGLPFVGKAGQLLDRMIQAMGLDPAKDVYVCNIIKCRPPGNRRPEPEEVASCIPYLHEQLARVDPKVIVALGNTSVAALLGTKLGITKVRGSWKLYRGKIPVMPTYHPSYLLRPGPTQAEAKRQVWEDLQSVMKELGLSRPARS